MRKLLLELDIYDAFKRENPVRSASFLEPVLGLILLADEVEAGVPCFGTMNITAKRNAYGRQLGSFHTDAEFDGLGQVPMTFIRAPYIAGQREGVEILAEVDGKLRLPDRETARDSISPGTGRGYENTRIFFLNM